MKKILFILIAFLALTQAHAQSKQELLQMLKKTYSDTAKVNILHTLAQQYWGKDSDTVALLTNQALELAQKAHFKRGIAQAYSDMGNIELQKDNPKKALAYHEDALKIQEKLKDKRAIALTYSNIGAVHGAKGKHKEALSYFMKALALEDELKQTDGLNKNLNKIGETYLSQSNYDKALEYYAKSLKLSEENKNPAASAVSYNNIGEIYRYQNEPKKAIEYYEKALAIREAQKDKQGTAEVWQNIAKLYMDTKEYEKAEEYSQRSLQLSREISYKNGIKINSETLSKIYQIQQKPEKALDYYKMFAGYKDSLQKAENERYLEQQKFSYQMSQKKQELDMMRKDLELKEFEREKQQNELEIAKKQAESERLLELAKEEKNQRKSDSLRQLAEKVQLQANLLQAEQLKSNADHELRLQKQKDAADFQWNIIYGSIALVIGMVIFAFFMYQSRQKQMRDKNELAEQKTLIEAEKQKAENLLLNILPLEIAQELKALGAAPPPRLYKSASVMFTDYSGFTEATERNSMEVVVMDLNECFVNFDRITANYGIEKIKTIGDAFMCAKGIPTPCNSHAVDMVLAGLEMQRFMIDRKKQKDAEGKFCFQCRLGINSGEVIAGIVGERKFCYDIWGNTVNTANRMELSGKVERVNISADTMELVKDFFEFEKRDPIQVKGKGIMQLYFVLRIKPEFSQDDKGIIPNDAFKKFYEQKFNEKYALPI